MPFLLVNWKREGLTFTQYSERNSVFKPVHPGSVGVIDGRYNYQYLMNLHSQKSQLRALNEAEIWNLDRTTDNPALAAQLHATLYSRFPDFVSKPT